METEQLIKELLKPEAYPEEEKVRQVNHIMTQMSAVFLTGNHAYKIKQPVNFGFLDYTTLEKRKHFCEEEVRLNREISPEIYLGVVPITEENGKIMINGSGKIVEYAVKMKQLPQERMMNKLLAKGWIDKAIIEKLAKKTAELHKKAERPEGNYGSWETVKFNWDENFEQTKEFIGKAIEKEDYELIMGYVRGFMEQNKELFEKRVVEKKIRRCHGDLHSGNIFVIDGDVHLFDRVEFNLRFTCVDVATEVAFMAMDLDFFGRENLSKQFVSKYIEITGDEEINKLLNFYKSYFAYVRAKINCFKYREAHTAEEERDKALEDAKKYFVLARRYAEQKPI